MKFGANVLNLAKIALMNLDPVVVQFSLKRLKYWLKLHM